VLARLDFGRPFFLPPNVPAGRVAALRKAFDDTMKDPLSLLKLKAQARYRSAQRRAGVHTRHRVLATPKECRRTRAQYFRQQELDTTRIASPVSRRCVARPGASRHVGEALGLQPTTATSPAM